MLKTFLKPKSDQFLKRWPKNPKIVFFAAPNTFSTEIIQRFSVDMGLPVVSMNQLLGNIQAQAGKDESLKHPFFMLTKEILDAGDDQALLDHKIPLKLLRLNNVSREGFILTDFPNSIKQAEMLEEYRGGMNSFVHLSLPDEILVAVEDSKFQCQHCGKLYFSETIVDEEQGIHIEPFVPKDGFCFDCGSSDIQKVGDAKQFSDVLQGYKANKDELLSFYDHLGLLVDFEMKTGYTDYPKLLDQILFNIKH